MEQLFYILQEEHLLILLLVDNSDTYFSYSELGVPNEVPISINDLGVAEFEGL